MSLFQLQQCLFDYLRAMEGAGPSADRPEIKTEGYDLTEDELEALRSGDIGAFYTMGTHPVIINGYARAMGYKRADYRPLLEKVATPSKRRTRWQSS